ncbi:MAG: hypothetical protein ACTS73_04160 [Arsenophonus sp. NEOnobi-MAG3]
MKKQTIIQIKKTLYSLPANIKQEISLVGSATICRIISIHALKLTHSTYPVHIVTVNNLIH